MVHRRTFLASVLSATVTPVFAQPRHLGSLMVIGGAEDKSNDRVILRRFVDLCGGPMSRIRVISAASSDPDAAWLVYERAFWELGAKDAKFIPIPDRDAANSSLVRSLILEADGIFISGGDQSRLMELIWQTDAYRALHIAFHVRGSCVGGTSAGAAVLSRNMLAQGEATKLPEKDIADLDFGLGLVTNAIIDQHFSQRGRLGRLLSVLAQRPALLGIGVDENTALIIERGSSVEVIGDGAVTVVDGRYMLTNSNSIDSGQMLELLGVQLHVIPTGNHYVLNSAEFQGRKLPVRFVEALRRLVEPGPIRS